MRAPRDGNIYQDRRQDDRGNMVSLDNQRGAGHPGGRGGGGDRGRSKRGGKKAQSQGGGELVYALPVKNSFSFLHKD